ncbi:MAG: hypothetical protein RLO50_11810 [Azospirillaceae bacterium]
MAAGAAMLAWTSPAAAAEGERIAWDGDLAPVCGDRASCALIDAFAAGSGGDGGALTVLELGFTAEDLRDHLQGGWGCRFDPGGFEGGREFWLLGDGAPRLVLQHCNDGYGAAQVGEDWVTIGDGTIEAWQYGGSAWRWETGGVLDLLAMALEESAACTAHGAWTWEVSATDWSTHRTLRAWQPMPAETGDEVESDWCPALDATSPWPLAPEGFTLGLAVPVYTAAADAVRDLGDCGLALGPGDDVSVAGGAPLLRLAIFAGTPSRLLIADSVGAAGVLEGASIDLTWTSSPLSALQYMAPVDTTATPGLGFARGRVDLASDGEGRGGLDWSRVTLTDGRALLAIDLPVTDPADPGRLPGGLVVAILGADGSVRAATVPWRDGAPVFAPGLAHHGRSPDGGCALTGGVGRATRPALLPGDSRQWL